MDLIPITHDRTRASSSSFASMYVTSKTEQASTYQYYYPPPPIPTPSPSFPIAAVTILSIISIAFLLLSYYIFVIKCCLNWQQLSPLLSRLSTSASPSGHNEDSLIFYSPSMEINRGLDQSAIRNLPTLQYNKVGNSGGIGRVGDRSLRCCSVCLSGFKDREMLRVLPRCNHVFHLDCIDVWLLKNANCPLCRSSISGRNRYPTDRIVAPSTSPEEMVSCDGIVLGDGTEEEDYVVVELAGISGGRGEQQRQYDGGTISVDEARLGHSKRIMVTRKGRTLHHHGPSIMGDECIDGRRKDEQFSSILPIKRSFSMDSAGDRGLYLQVHEIVRRQSSLIDVNESTGESNSGTSSSSRVPRSRSFFTIGSGRRSSSVLPVESNI